MNLPKMTRRLYWKQTFGVDVNRYARSKSLLEVPHQRRTGRTLCHRAAQWLAAVTALHSGESSSHYSGLDLGAHRSSLLGPGDHRLWAEHGAESIRKAAVDHRQGELSLPP